MAWSAYETQRPRADGTIPGRRLTDAQREAIRLRVKRAESSARASVVSAINAETGLSKGHINKIASGGRA